MTSDILYSREATQSSPPSVRGGHSPPVRGRSVEDLWTHLKELTTVYLLAPDDVYSSSMQNTLTPSQDPETHPSRAPAQNPGQ